MNKKSPIKEDMSLVIFLLCLALTCVLVLTLGNGAYEKKLEELRVYFYMDLMKENNIPFTEENAMEVFKENFQSVTYRGNEYYRSIKFNKGQVTFTSSGPGLWSVIELLITIDPEREQILSLKVLKQGETPGLGARIKEEAFLESFNGKRIRPQIHLMPQAREENEIDAITGATVTSRAVEKIINNGVSLLDTLIKEGHFDAE